MSDLSPVWPSARIMLGVRVLRIFSLFGGVMLDSELPGYTAKSGLHQGSSFTMDLWNVPVEVYPKLFVGIKF